MVLNKALFLFYPKNIQQKFLRTDHPALAAIVAGSQSGFEKLSITCCSTTFKANAAIRLGQIVLQKPNNLNPTISETENNKGLCLTHIACPKQTGGWFNSPDPG